MATIGWCVAALSNRFDTWGLPVANTCWIDPRLGRFGSGSPGATRRFITFWPSSRSSRMFAPGYWFATAAARGRKRSTSSVPTRTRSRVFPARKFAPATARQRPASCCAPTSGSDRRSRRYLCGIRHTGSRGRSPTAARRSRRRAARAASAAAHHGAPALVEGAHHPGDPQIPLTKMLRPTGEFRLPVAAIFPRIRRPGTVLNLLAFLITIILNFWRARS